jgi:hypothetical protein
MPLSYAALPRGISAVAQKEMTSANDTARRKIAAKARLFHRASPAEYPLFLSFWASGDPV